MARSGARDLVWGHEARVTQRSKGHSAVGTDHQVSDAAVVERQSQPTFWGELQCSADDVADDVGVAHEDLVAVLLLLGVRSVDEVSKGSLDAGSIFVILLRAQLHTAHSSTACTPHLLNSSWSLAAPLGMN